MRCDLLIKQDQPIFDAHVHSRFSVDGRDDLEDICSAAITKGLKYICFTEHFDMNPSDYGCRYLRMDAYSDALIAAREKFRPAICVLKGIEFSEPHIYPDAFREIVSADFDQITASVHYLGADYVGADYMRERMSIEELSRLYFIEVLRMVEFGGFDVLGHMDFPKRYHGRLFLPFEIIDRIVRGLVSGGIVPEINTSPLRKGIDESSPDLAILERYVEAGGRRATFGSDAHSCDEIGAGFQYAVQLAETAGISEIGLFQHRKFITVGSISTGGSLDNQ